MWGTFPLFSLCLLSAFPAGAKGEGGKVPVALLLVSGLGYEDLKEGRPAGALRPLAERGMLALLEPAVAGEPTEAAVYWSVGAGVPISAPDTGGKTVNEAGLTRTMAEVAQDAYPFAGAEGQVVARGYRRRYGEYPPLESVALHLGVPALRDRQNDAATAARIGALGDALKKAGLRVAVYGDWRAVSVGMDERGATYAGTMRPITPEALEAAVRESDVTIVNAATPRTLRMYVAAFKNAPDVNLLIAAVAPPFTRHTKPLQWAYPGFLFAVGPAFSSETIPVSRSTHLPGLVSALDIAPTVAALAGASFDGVAESSLTTARKIKTHDSFASLGALDRQVAVRDKIGGKALIFALALAMLALLPTLILMTIRRPRFYNIARVCVWFAAALPAALLLTGILAPQHMGLYFGAVALFALLAAALGASLVQRLPFSPLALILLLTAALVLGDYTADQTLLYRSDIYEPGFDAALRSIGYLSFGLCAALCGASLFFARRPAVAGVVVLTLFILALTAMALWLLQQQDIGYAPLTAIARGSFAPLALTLIEWMLCASSPSIMAQRESASR